MSDTALSATAKPVLPESEAARRVALLAELQAALRALGVHALMVRNRRLVLRNLTGSGMEPSGPTDPSLHIYLANGTDKVTTDGTTFQPASSPAYPADDPTAAAAGIFATWAKPDSP